MSPLSRLTLTNPWHFLALGFGSGLSPKAPGTFGTLAALPLVWLALQPGPWFYLGFTLLACVIGVYICGRAAQDMGVHDHGAIVWDEVAGMLLTMLWVPLSWSTLLAGFILFRLFDILKPWPISYCDKQVHGGLGIMLDDILAGIAACISLHALLQFGFL
ncbi:phosphatidylglycerophosphatase A [Aliiglaciecola sp. CAU 1673]|uniref:phosphatidylglycerophosphatase A family protein n=1 Tax=Aliiglaciecola sp. CAU 1673 TaxID=3032595 RepID=UPI0023D9D352|nr:phosphatidylglycerophosphatase A [Aliiglaciecola sp. CAU 1673]MDF2178023.1 phosphatidylglycerophosphatase A [Aliiglaciecola sp. CAU 1673]